MALCRGEIHRQGESKQRELVVAEPTSWIDQVFGFVGFIKDLRTAVQITLAIQRLRYQLFVSVKHQHCTQDACNIPVWESRATKEMARARRYHRAG